VILIVAPIVYGFLLLQNLPTGDLSVFDCATSAGQLVLKFNAGSSC